MDDSAVNSLSSMAARNRPTHEPATFPGSV
jgi:hypothetical protein